MMYAGRVELSVRRVRYRASGVVLIVLPLLASAHHSRAEYSEQKTEFEGEFVRASAETFLRVCFNYGEKNGR